MGFVHQTKERILAGSSINRNEALRLSSEPLDELCSAADEIRKSFCGNSFDICTIINGKCGRCPEDCKFCAQSSRYKTEISEYPLLDADTIAEQAKKNADSGVMRFSIVTSGKRLSPPEVDSVCKSIAAIKTRTDIGVCVSLGLLDEEDFRKLKSAGAERVHCNLESSESYFKSVCTTHTYAQKIETLKAAQRAGLSVCSGGIMGLGESMEDRIDMAITLRGLGIKSVPVNFLSPIHGTPYERNQPLSDEEKLRIIAVYRFILPDAYIRLAGGRGQIPDKGERCFRSGANAAISGDMLTTSGITTATDMELIRRLGFIV